MYGVRPVPLLKVVGNPLWLMFHGFLERERFLADSYAVPVVRIGPVGRVPEYPEQFQVLTDSFGELGGADRALCACIRPMAQRERYLKATKTYCMFKCVIELDEPVRSRIPASIFKALFLYRYGAASPAPGSWEEFP